MREMFGSMAKSFQPGRAAQNGYTAALLGARRLHGRRARHRRAARVRGRARGRVRPRQGHGEARRRLRPARQRLQAVRVRHRRASDDRRLHPALPRAPSGGRGHRGRAPARRAARARSLQQEGHAPALESKYSIYHAAAIGLVRGKGGLQEFTDDAIRDPEVRARARRDHGGRGPLGHARTRCTSRSTLRNGRKLTKFVEQSLGNVHRPLSNEQLDGEVRRPGRAGPAARASRRRARSVLANRRARGRRRPARATMPRGARAPSSRAGN